MKIFLTSQIKELDAKTIKAQDISSSELMDRAAHAAFCKIKSYLTINDKIIIISGPGNNGGDALAIAILLLAEGYNINTVICNFGKSLSDDAKLQLERLKKIKGSKIYFPTTARDLSDIEKPDVIIEGLFGTGLNKSLEGDFAETVFWINKQNIPVISIDLPGGLFGEDNRDNTAINIVHSNHVIGLQFPRISYLLPENEKYIENWEVVDIGIDKKSIDKTETDFYFTGESDVKDLLHKRKRFSHKGSYGKCLLIAGSKGMAGAAILSAKGAIRSGAGLLTVKIPNELYPIIQTSVPEALALTYENGNFWEINCISANWSAIAVGSGLGKGKSKTESLEILLKQKPGKLILDADSLNILSENTYLLEFLPESCILTPHPGEFDRLIGKESKTGYERLKYAIKFAKNHRIYLILKGAYSACINPYGQCHFNSTGNPGMATGGTGDVLTGILLSLLAQGYSEEETCVLGTYIHGLCGDLALQNQSLESLVAGDLPENLGKAFNQIKNY